MKARERLPMCDACGEAGDYLVHQGSMGVGRMGVGANMTVEHHLLPIVSLCKGCYIKRKLMAPVGEEEKHE